MTDYQHYRINITIVLAIVISFLTFLHYIIDGDNKQTINEMSPKDRDSYIISQSEELCVIETQLTRAKEMYAACMNKGASKSDACMAKSYDANGIIRSGNSMAQGYYDNYVNVRKIAYQNLSNGKKYVNSCKSDSNSVISGI